MTALDLQYNNITDKGAAHLAELLVGNVGYFTGYNEIKTFPNCHTLVFTFIVHSQYEDSAVRSLDLMFNDIRTDGAEVLSRSLQVHVALP